MWTELHQAAVKHDRLSELAFAYESAAAGRTLDKFENERQEFFEHVRADYLERAAAEPQRIRIVDSSRPVADVRVELAGILAALG